MKENPTNARNILKVNLRELNSFIYFSFLCEFLYEMKDKKTACKTQEIGA